MRVDELLLSCFEGRVAAEVVGSRFVSEAAMASLFPRAGSSTRIQEASGSWRFERYRTESVD
jgi:hypothetical protein